MPASSNSSTFAPSGRHRPQTHHPLCSDTSGCLGVPVSSYDGRLSVSAGLPAPGLAVVRPVGEIDRRTARRWAWFMARAVQGLAVYRHRARADDRSAGPPRLICDLSGVEFLACCGLGALVEAGDRAANAGVEMRLVVATRPVRRVLELTSLGTAWPVHRQLSDAVRPLPVVAQSPPRPGRQT